MVYEGFIEDWLLEELNPIIDKSQFGNQRGQSTEHLLVCLMDQIHKLLDSNPNNSAIIASLIDWASAFDRQDATQTIARLIKMNVRSWLIPIIADYLTGRSCTVRFNGENSSEHELPGAGSQGTILGMLLYQANTNQNTDFMDPDMCYKWVDDVTLLELVLMGGLLTQYNFRLHVASDIGIDEHYLPPQNLKTQQYLDQIQDWTATNLMKINEKKCNYMIFSRSHTEVSTRLEINDSIIDRIEEQKLLGLWLSTYLDYERNTREICRKAYGRISLLTKLKYVGTSLEDLLTIYILFI